MKHYFLFNVLVLSSVKFKSAVIVPNKMIREISRQVRSSWTRVYKWKSVSKNLMDEVVRQLMVKNNPLITEMERQ